MSQKFDLAVVLNMPDLPEQLQKVESRIATALQTDSSAMSDALLRLTQAKGKRLRPALVMACTLLSGGKIDNSVINAAAAVELIHIGSLVHDDIIDNASTRWGVPTINSQEGSDSALLGGDYLFAKACSLATESSQTAGILAAETIAELCNGQSAELAVQNNVHRTEAELDRAINGKTAALLAAACKVGGICAGASEDNIATLVQYGFDFGRSFQLIDDVLDFISTDTLMGKPVGNDVNEGVYTLPVILSMNGQHRAQVEKQLTAKDSLVALTELLIQDGSIQETLSRAQKHNQSAEQVLSKAFGTGANNVAQFPGRYHDWVLSNLIAPDYKNKLTT